MRKILALAILAMLALFAVVGCGGQQTVETPATETTPPPAEEAAPMDSTMADTSMAH
jgi:hypothetical protein